ncbi:MAG TPA: hypothetical protein VI981_02880 [Candidatus Paceibacterota bacterium]
MRQTIIVESDLIGKFAWELPPEMERNFKAIGEILRSQHPPEIATKMEEHGHNELRSFITSHLETLVGAYGIGGTTSNQILVALREYRNGLALAVQEILKNRP